MAEAIGLVLGFAGLAGTFKSCLELFDQVRAAKSHGKDYQILATRLDAKKALFSEWGKGVGLLNTDSDARDHRLERVDLEPVIGGILNCIYLLLKEADHLMSKYRYKELAGPAMLELGEKSDACIPSGQRTQPLEAPPALLHDQIRKRQRGTTFQKKVRWAIHDLSELTDLIKSLDDIIGDLYKIVPVAACDARFTEVTERLTPARQDTALKELHDSSNKAPLVRTFELKDPAQQDLIKDIISVAPSHILIKPTIDTTALQVRSQLKNQKFEMDTIPSTQSLNEDLLDPLKLVCITSCSCICHSRRRLAFYGIFDSLIGSLYVNWPGQWTGRPPCNEISCLRRSETWTRIVYTLPSWLSRHAFSLKWTHAPRDGPKASLKCPRVVPDNADIFHFAKSGDLEGIRSLFRKGLASPHDTNASWGVTPLSYATQGLHLHLCRFLIAEGADPDTENKSHISALDITWSFLLTGIYESIARENEVRQIFSLFSDSDWVEEQQFPILHKILFGFIGRDLEDELRISTSTINIPDSKGRTPLTWAAARGNEAAVRTLLRYGANPNPIDSTGNTPLHRAARARTPHCIAPLLEGGARVGQKSKQGFTALHYAAYYQDSEDYLLPLLQHGAPIEAQDSYRWTPLVSTTEYDHRRSASLLLKSGAEVNTQTSDGWTPFLHAVNSNSHRILQLLLESAADYRVRSFKKETYLHFAAHRADLETMHLLGMAKLDGVDVEEKNTEGLTARDVMRLRVRKSPDLAPTDLQLAFEDLLKGICVVPGCPADDRATAAAASDTA